MGIPKKILIARTDRLGDVILSTPVIKNLRLYYPKAHIAFICRPYTQEVLIGNPYLDEIIVYDKYGKHKSIWGTIKFAWELKKKKFDLALILHPTNRMHLVSFFAAIPRRIGWAKNMDWSLSERLPHTKQEGQKHELEYTLDILRYLKIPVKDKELFFPVSVEAKKRVDKLLKEADLGVEDEFIVIHPSASCPSKRWPQDYFSEVIKILQDKLKIKVVVITSKKEASFAQKITKQNKVIDFRGRLNISEIGAILQRASLFISNDSGPVHIAASVNTPVISIFGRKDSGLSPKRWKPLGENSTYLHKDSGCSVCFAHNCKEDFICLGKITPQEVVEKSLLILNKT
ncbi:MAG: lipopolysaccharide heptosyltransferase II [Candidatus Omnitrophica bacterium]|nr:lipopolysaccharide heptosyltransferase II [Candidatus Omnitrophota bacterium]